LTVEIKFTSENKNTVKNKDGKVWVSQKAIIFGKDGKMLTIRRSKTAPSRPLKWDLPGGTFGLGEKAKEALVREIKEETGLAAKNLRVADVVSGFNDINEFWVSIFYTAEAVGDKIILSYEHDDFKWVTLDEFLEMETSPRIKEFAENLEKSYGK